MEEPTINSNQPESEIFNPSQEIVSNANIQDYDSVYQRSIADPQGFWADRAEELEWFKPWDQVLDDSNPPFYKWFVGGKTNIVHNTPVSYTHLTLPTILLV